MNKKGFKLMRFGFVLVILGVMLCILSRDYFLSLKEPVDIYQLYPEEILPGLHVQTDIDMIWDYLYTETTTHTTYGIKTSEEESARGYVIPLCYVDDDGYVQVDKFMGMKISRKADYDTLEKIMDDTYAWWFEDDDSVDYTVYPIEGKIVKMGSDEKELMEEYLTDYLGLSQSEAEEYMHPYMLVPIYPKTDGVMLIVGAIIAVVGLLIIILCAVQANKMKNANNMSFQIKTNDPNVVAVDSMNTSYNPESAASQSNLYGQSTYAGMSGGSNTAAPVSPDYNAASQSDLYGQSTYAGGAAGSLYGAQPTTGQSLYGAQPTAEQSLYGAQPTTGQSLYGAQPATGQSLYGSQPLTNQNLYESNSNAAAPVSPDFNPGAYGNSESADTAYNNQPADLFGTGSFDTPSSDYYSQAPYDTPMDVFHPGNTDNP